MNNQTTNNPERYVATLRACRKALTTNTHFCSLDEAKAQVASLPQWAIDQIEYLSKKYEEFAPQVQAFQQINRITREVLP